MTKRNYPSPLFKHLEVIEKKTSNGKKKNYKKTIKIKSQKACNVYKCVFRTLANNNVKINQIINLTNSEYNTFIQTLLYYE